MTTVLQSPDALADLLRDLQRRAQTLHSDVTDRFVRARIRALASQIRQISAALDSPPGRLAQIIASELIEAMRVVLQQMERDAQRPLQGAG